MTQKSTSIPNYDTTPLLHEIEIVVNKGLSNMLHDFNNRYTLLETTQQKIMELLQTTVNTPDIDESKLVENSFEEDESILVSIKDMTKELVKHEMDLYQQTTNLKMNDIHNLIQVLVNKITNLEDDIKKITYTESENIKLIIKEKEDIISNSNNYTSCNEETTNTNSSDYSYEDEQKQTKLEIFTTISDDTTSSDNESTSSTDSDDEVPQHIQNTNSNKEQNKEDKNNNDQNKEEEEQNNNEEDENNNDQNNNEEDQNNNDQNNNEDENNNDQNNNDQNNNDQNNNDQNKEEEENTELNTKNDELNDVETENEEEEEEMFFIEINNVTYCTNDEENGFIYELLEDDDIGKKIGYFKNGKSHFY
jgi:hypothetical protein